MYRPLISVIIPCYNCEAYLAAAIESALSQTYSNLEIIVVDDGSSDRSWDIIQSYKTVISYRQKNSGACVARNLGLSKASGDFIKFLDADDLLHSECLEKQVIFLLSLDDPNTIVYGDSILFQSDISKGVYKNRLLGTDGSLTINDFLFGNILTSLTLYPKELLDRFGGFSSALSSKQEWQLHLKLFLLGCVFVYKNDLTYYQRKHDSVHRISNRKWIADKELINLDEIYRSLPHQPDVDYNAAWAWIYWIHGRQFLKRADRVSAQIFFDKAMLLSPDHYKKYWPSYYKWLVFLLGADIPEQMLLLLRNIRSKLTG